MNAEKFKVPADFTTSVERNVSNFIGERRSPSTDWYINFARKRRSPSVEWHINFIGERRSPSVECYINFIGERPFIERGKTSFY